MKKLAIYLDCRCSKSGLGAIAFAAQYHNHVDYTTIETDSPDNTTMSVELIGALQVLEYAKSKFMPGRTFTVVIDSSYVFKGLTQWLANWEANGWRTADNKEIKNVAVWRRFYYLSKLFNITWRLVDSKCVEPMYVQVNSMSSGIMAALLEQEKSDKSAKEEEAKVSETVEENVVES